MDTNNDSELKAIIDTMHSPGCKSNTSSNFLQIPRKTHRLTTWNQLTWLRRLYYCLTFIGLIDSTSALELFVVDCGRWYIQPTCASSFPRMFPWKRAQCVSHWVWVCMLADGREWALKRVFWWLAVEPLASSPCSSPKPLEALAWFLPTHTRSACLLQSSLEPTKWCSSPETRRWCLNRNPFYKNKLDGS